MSNSTPLKYQPTPSAQSPFSNIPSFSSKKEELFTSKNLFTNTRLESGSILNTPLTMMADSLAKKPVVSSGELSLTVPPLSTPTKQSFFSTVLSPKPEAKNFHSQEYLNYLSMRDEQEEQRKKNLIVEQGKNEIVKSISINPNLIYSTTRYGVLRNAKLEGQDQQGIPSDPITLKPKESPFGRRMFENREADQIRMVPRSQRNTNVSYDSTSEEVFVVAQTVSERMVQTQTPDFEIDASTQTDEVENKHGDELPRRIIRIRDKGTEMSDEAASLEETSWIGQRFSFQGSVNVPNKTVKLAEDSIVGDGDLPHTRSKKRSKKKKLRHQANEAHSTPIVYVMDKGGQRMIGKSSSGTQSISHDNSSDEDVEGSEEDDAPTHFENRLENPTKQGNNSLTSAKDHGKPVGVVTEDRFDEIKNSLQPEVQHLVLKNNQTFYSEQLSQENPQFYRQPFVPQHSQHVNNPQQNHNTEQGPEMKSYNVNNGDQQTINPQFIPNNHQSYYSEKQLAENPQLYRQSFVPQYSQPQQTHNNREQTLMPHYVNHGNQLTTSQQLFSQPYAPQLQHQSNTMAKEENRILQNVQYGEEVDINQQHSLIDVQNMQHRQTQAQGPEVKFSNVNQQIYPQIIHNNHQSYYSEQQLAENPQLYRQPYVPHSSQPQKTFYNLVESDDMMPHGDQQANTQQMYRQPFTSHYSQPQINNMIPEENLKILHNVQNDKVEIDEQNKPQGHQANTFIPRNNDQQHYLPAHQEDFQPKQNVDISVPSKGFHTPVNQPTVGVIDIQHNQATPTQASQHQKTNTDNSTGTNLQQNPQFTPNNHQSYYAEQQLAENLQVYRQSFVPQYSQPQRNNINISEGFEADGAFNENHSSIQPSHQDDNRLHNSTNNQISAYEERLTIGEVDNNDVDVTAVISHEIIKEQFPQFSHRLATNVPFIPKGHNEHLYYPHQTISQPQHHKHTLLHVASAQDKSLPTEYHLDQEEQQGYYYMQKENQVYDDSEHVHQPHGKDINQEILNHQTHESSHRPLFIPTNHGREHANHENQSSQQSLNEAGKNFEYTNIQQVPNSNHSYDNQQETSVTSSKSKSLPFIPRNNTHAVYSQVSEVDYHPSNSQQITIPHTGKNSRQIVEEIENTSDSGSIETIESFLSDTYGEEADQVEPLLQVVEEQISTDSDQDDDFIVPNIKTVEDTVEPNDSDFYAEQNILPQNDPLYDQPQLSPSQLVQSMITTSDQKKKRKLGFKQSRDGLINEVEHINPWSRIIEAPIMISPNTEVRVDDEDEETDKLIPPPEFSNEILTSPRVKVTSKDDPEIQEELLPTIAEVPQAEKSDTGTNYGSIPFGKGLYMGETENGLPHGKGTYTGPDMKYEGSWEHGKKCGKGRIEYPDGSIYEGDLDNDVRQGEGVYTSPNYNYEGSWKNDKRNGTGIVEYHKLKEKYEGSIMNNLPHGKGIYTFNEGSVFSGEFHMGWRHGTGTLSYGDGTTHYDGTWEMDRQSGTATITYLEGAYQGEVRNDKRNGHGIFKYANGDVFDGMWLNDKKNGPGTHFFGGIESGTFYKGQWENGKKHGVGVQHMIDTTSPKKVVNKSFEESWIHGRLNTKRPLL